MTARRALRIPAAAIRMMVAHARRAQPRECCGLLVGAGSRVAFAVPLSNIARGRTRYQVDPAEHIALRRILREVAPAADIVGVYHSHPAGPATPSATDIAEALYAGWFHVIVGLGGRRPVTRAFTIARGRSRPVTLRRV